MTRLARPHPLVARVEPITGESLLSLLVRAADANVFPRLADLLQHAGIAGHPAFAPFTATRPQADALASLLGVDLAEVHARLHSPVQATPGREEVGWAGGRLERRFIEARTRRVSPASLARSPHHRMAWTNRALAFCPQSFQQLISRCHACGRELGWTHTAGLDRCEHCRALLMDAPAPFVLDAIRPPLAGAAELADTDPAVHRLALLALPVVFHRFDPSEAFTAVVELGAAWSLPHVERGSETGRRLATGQLVLTAEQLAAGYVVMQEWPHSYGELVGRIWRAHSQASSSTPSTASRRLGLLGRWFDHRQVGSLFGQLLRDGIDEAAEQGGLPLKGSRPGAVSLLTLTEASQLHGVSKPVLVRLVPDGLCVAGGKLGRGGTVQFRAEALAGSLRGRRAGLSPAQTRAALGVPAYCLPALVEAGLLADVVDLDAVRMAGTDALYDRSSVEGLLVRILGRCTGIAWGHALAPMMRRLFQPGYWARVIKALAEGELELGEPHGRSTRGLLYQLNTDWEPMIDMVVPLRGHPPGLDATLNTYEAGLLLGVSDVLVPELVATGLLAARREGKSWRIELADVVAFDRLYRLNGKLLELDGRCRAPNRSYWRCCAPVAQTRHLRVIPREDDEGGSQVLADVAPLLVAERPDALSDNLMVAMAIHSRRPLAEIEAMFEAVCAHHRSPPLEVSHAERQVLPRPGDGRAAASGPEAQR